MSSNIHSASQEEILEKAIQKAIDGGFDGESLWTVAFTAQGAAKALLRYSNPHINALIFNHDFAKALWGYFYPASYASDPNWVNSFDKEKIGKDAWQYHLQQMVIADDPIKYLGENI